MLPYQTLGEASAALGRNLTYAETLWFITRPASPTTSSTATQFFFSSSSSPSSLSSGIRGDRALGRIRPLQDSAQGQVVVARNVSVLQGCHALVLSHRGSAAARFVSSCKMIGIRTGLPLPSGWEIVAQLLVYFMVEDYTNYWIHRFLHNKWGYEKIHRVHHEYSAPIGFAAPYAHWAEILILGIPSFLGPAMAPGHIITFWLWIALRQIEAIETHSGYDIPWSPTKYIPFYGGAEYHDYHHYVGGQSQSNFASVFTYCDYIYGTDKGYRYQKRLFQKLKGELKTSVEQNGGSYHISTQDLKSD
ncbi:hypothetical protein SLA2020_378020 [Shorea laevis]